MRKTLGACAIGVAIVLGAVGPGPVAAQNGPSNRCYGEIASGIASTWPWAHDGKEEFPPPRGGIAKWLQEFGPEVGVSTVRELQLLFCSE